MTQANNMINSRWNANESLLEKYNGWRIAPHNEPNTKLMWIDNTPAVQTDRMIQPGIHQTTLTSNASVSRFCVTESTFRISLIRVLFAPHYVVLRVCGRALWKQIIVCELTA